MCDELYEGWYGNYEEPYSPPKEKKKEIDTSHMSFEELVVAPIYTLYTQEEDELSTEDSLKFISDFVTKKKIEIALAKESEEREIMLEKKKKDIEVLKNEFKRLL